MATITQTVPSYIGGISEQPDHAKFPGQVRSVQNAIPDATYGLYKRPGSKRVGSTKLTNVQSGGSWFHYYRDETEGSYIGQIAADGTARMWSCNDGSEKTVYYHAMPWVASTAYAVGDKVQHNSNIYVCDTAGTSASSGGPSGTGSNISDGSTQWDYEQALSTIQASIKGYLTPTPSTDTEDLQVLTINDTTFINNRSKTVGTTGVTDSRPDAHFAYLEVVRTENGRQYALNIHDPSSNATTNITRATRVKIDSDNLAEGAGTGHCPGIGTQVFSGGETNTGSKKNLTFRITALGQQGRHSGSTSGTPAASDYACSYNREITLLHGGEGWGVNDTTTQTLDQAQTNYNYVVKVTEAETVAVSASIAAIRPAPTPFDADTAVTVDTVIGGIIAEINAISGTPITAKQIGTGIYLSSSSAFNVDVMDNDLMRVMQGTVNDVTKLPIQCKNGYIVKVSNTRMSDEDDYYTRFYGPNGADGSGVWIECPEPGIIKSLDASTMPHIIQRQANGHFLAKRYEWKDRTVGDSVTNPLPSFVGQSINKVVFFRNRLVFLSGENVITSRPGTIDLPNFFNNSALTIAATDPVDISCASLYPSELFDAIEVNAGLLCFSTNQQFLLSSDDTVFNPDTAKLRTISNHNYNKIIPPIKTTQTVGFIDNSFKYSRFMELFEIKREGEPQLLETSKVAPTLLPKDIDLITNSVENNLMFFGKTDSDTIIGFRYLRLGEETSQQAWFKWKFHQPLLYHFAIEDTYYILDKDHFLQRVNLIQADTDPSIDQDDINYLLHLDNYTTVGSGSYDSVANKTTFTNQSDWIDDVSNVTNGKLVVVDSNTNASRLGRYAECTVINGDDFTVPGDWSSATLNIGYLYDYQVDFPRIYVKQQQGKNNVIADINSKLTVHRVKLNFGKIGLYETTLTRVGKAAYTEIYESTDLDEYNVSDAPYLEEKIKDIPVYEQNKNVDIAVKSAHPAPATLRSMSWEGDFSPMHYRRL